MIQGAEMKNHVIAENLGWRIQMTPSKEAKEHLERRLEQIKTDAFRFHGIFKKHDFNKLGNDCMFCCLEFAINKIDKLKAENERLREALEKIENNKWVIEVPVGTYGEGVRDGHLRCSRWAKEVLVKVKY